MHKVGLIGYGKWGKILYNKLKNICDLKFICTSKDDYESKLKDVEWVVIATPNDTHYNIVRNCILNKKNIFCEKPLTPTTKQSKMLFDYAEMMGVKLYVNDIQNYRNYNFSFNLSNSIIQNNENRKSKQEAHHLGIDFTILESHFLGLKAEFIKNEFINTNTNDTFCDINYQFSYKNIDFNLEWSNIFNVKTYTSTIVTDYSVIGTSFNLRPSQLFIKVSFPL